MDSQILRPFTVDGRQTRLFACVNGLLGRKVFAFARSATADPADDGPGVLLESFGVPPVDSGEVQIGGVFHHV